MVNLDLEKRFPLTTKCLEKIMRGEQTDEPLLQILGCKKIVGNSDKERYRVMLSDGFYCISYAMMTANVMEKFPSRAIETYAVVQLKNFTTSFIPGNGGRGNKRVLVIVDLEVVAPGNDVGGKIGDPQPLSENAITETKSTENEASTSTVPSSSSTSSRPNPVVFNQKKDNGSGDNSFNGEIVFPIASLSPYQNKWVIKARIANKSSIRTWSNSRGEGKLFSIDLIDETGEIRATLFRDLVDKYYDTIEVDKIYYISKAQLKLANKQFNTLNNDYEMVFSSDTIIQECMETDSSIPQTQFNFVPIDKLLEMDVGTFVDIIGICKSASDLISLQARSTGRELKKREVTLVDQTNSAVSLSLWGSEAEKFDTSRQPVLAVKGAKIGEFGGGKTLSVFNTTILKIDPDIPEAHRLRGWFDNGGVNNEAINISARSGAGGLQTPWLSFKEVEMQGLGNDEKGSYYQVMGTVLLFRGENMVYKACPKPECNKKVREQGGMYVCDKCGKDYPNFKYRLLASVNIGDWSGNQWVNLFASEAEKLLGMTSQEVGEKIEENSEAMMTITDKAHFKQFIFKCRIKSHVFNDEARLKTVAVNIDPINYKEYHSQYLIPRIEQLIK